MARPARVRMLKHLLPHRRFRRRRIFAAFQVADAPMMGGLFHGRIDRKLAVAFQLAAFGLTHKAAVGEHFVHRHSYGRGDRGRGAPRLLFVVGRQHFHETALQ